MNIRQITDRFFVAPQIEATDMQALAEAGFSLVINNRPDMEVGPDQASDAMQAAAEAAVATARAEREERTAILRKMLQAESAAGKMEDPQHKEAWRILELPEGVEARAEADAAAKAAAKQAEARRAERAAVLKRLLSKRSNVPAEPTWQVLEFSNEATSEPTDEVEVEPDSSTGTGAADVQFAGGERVAAVSQGALPLWMQHVSMSQQAAHTRKTKRSQWKLLAIPRKLSVKRSAQTKQRAHEGS